MADVEYANDDYEDEDAPYLPAVGMSIPVPKSFGKRVRKLFEETKETFQFEHKKWDRSFELYRQCGDEGIELDDGTSYAHHFENEADENIIRNNVRTIMRSTYMQNPHLEFTDVTTDKLADSLEYIISFIMNKKTYPGINMKPKARRWILHGQLTNFGVIRLDFQPHEGSRQQAVVELQKIEAKLATAKSQKELDQCYAHLEQLHKTLPLSQNKGIALTNVMPQRIVVDPRCTHLDLSDADWLAEDFDMDRVFMQETYYYRDEEDGTLRMRSNPSATTEDVAEAATDDIKEKVVDLVINARTEEQQDLLKKGTVRCVYFYDKILRRVSLFNTEDWSHPLWVSNDDMGLSRFFRHFIIAFGEPIDGIIQPGETSYYIGQINQINRINRKAASIRDVIFNTLVYNKKQVDSKEVAKLISHMRNPTRVRAFGIANDADGKISEMLEALAPPSFQYKEVFDTAALRQAVDRSASISKIEQGEQFKTNTTNDQVNFYAQNRQETTSVLIDAIEDSFEALGWSISEILVSKYTKEDIVELVGPVKAEGFEPMTVQEFNQKYRMEIAAGSIEKPTSEFKKREALGIAQALGQLGQAAPGTTISIMLRMFQTAFSNLIVKEEDWAQLQQEISANLTKGVSTNAPTA
jgi:hypothetical protein